jgi:formylglycine-generating enzyme required for sulfatase activity
MMNKLFWHIELCMIVILGAVLAGCSQKSITEEMVYFEAGTVSMRAEYGEINELTVHEEKVASFYLSKELVTLADFRTFVKGTAHRHGASTRAKALCSI